MKTDRWFFSAAGASFLVIMLVGFRWFVTTGKGNEGRVIDPTIFRLDLIHGLAIAAWFLLFFSQSLLITVRNRRLHFKLGWAAVAVGLTILVTGTLVAVRSVQVTPPEFHFFGMLYCRFLLVMFTEIGLFTAFVATGILTRKKPRIHRPAMVMASLCLLGGATARMPFLHPSSVLPAWSRSLDRSSASAQSCCLSAASSPADSIAGSPRSMLPSSPSSLSLKNLRSQTPGP